MKLAGRTALIAGASQGLGLAIARAFVAEGARVIVCARDVSAVSRELDAHRCDVSKPDEVTALIAQLPALDILVNCAGIYGPKGVFEDNDWSAWVQAIEIDLFGAVLLCRAVVPQMKRRGHGKIIQLSGGGATAPLPRLSAYAAAKAAVVRFAETIAVELAPHRIDVNCIAPGALNTRMLQEVLDAGPAAVGEEFYNKALAQQQSGGASLEHGAALAVFLASAASDGITGKLISAVWDPWAELPEHAAELAGDIYTLRRIVPADRGKSWGDKR